MCDQDQLRIWAKDALNRRQFGAMAGAGALAACAPMETGNMGAPLSLTERRVTFPAGNHTIDGFFVAPEGRESPAVLFWPDIAGLREAKRNMARRLAGEGYAVFVINPYYRDVSGEQFANFAEFAASGGFEKVKPWRAKFDSDSTAFTARHVLDFLDAQPEVDSDRPFGTQGYCMGGPLALWTAAAHDARFGAAASFHGGGLVRDDTRTSPSVVIRNTDVDYLVAIAKNDDAKDPDHKGILANSVESAGDNSKVAVYDGDHGWTVPDSPAYAAVAAEKAYADLIAIYADAL